MIKKNFIFTFLCICSIVLLVGCGNTQNNINTAISNTTNSASSNSTDTESILESIDYDSLAEKQLSEPQKGETIAILHVKDYGDINVKFFESKAPKAVENFITHSKNGYYNNVIFHRVINEFMIQGGDPEGTGYGGESIWNKGFDEEISLDLVPYRGSLCMASSKFGTSSLGSQFFITQANYSEEMEKLFSKYSIPANLISAYKKYGGYLSLYGSYTVFGQVTSGMDIVDKIANIETDEKDKPVTDVIIESIEIKEY